MSSPRGSVREGTRIVLKEITATLHNSSPIPPPRRKVMIIEAFDRRRFSFSSKRESPRRKRAMYALSRRCFSHLRSRGINNSPSGKRRRRPVLFVRAAPPHPPPPPSLLPAHAADSRTGECISINKRRISRGIWRTKINLASRHAGAFL